MSKKHVVHIIRKNKLKLTDEDIDDIFETKYKNKSEYVYCFNKKVIDIKDIYNLLNNNKNEFSNLFCIKNNYLAMLISNTTSIIQKMIYRKIYEKLNESDAYMTQVQIMYVGNNYNNKNEYKPVLQFLINLNNANNGISKNFILGIPIKFTTYCKKELNNFIIKNNLFKIKNNKKISNININTEIYSYNKLKKEKEYILDLDNLIYLPHNNFPTIDVLDNIGYQRSTNKVLSKTNYNNIINKSRNYIRRSLFDSFYMSDRDVKINFIGINPNLNIILNEIVFKNKNIKILISLSLDIYQNSDKLNNSITEMINLIR